MNIIVNHNVQTPAYKQIYNQIRDAIVRGDLQDGSKLPSERILAQKLSVHRNTVIHAYGDLKADGYIDSRQGRGHIVTFGFTEDTSVQTGKHAAEHGIYWPALMKDVSGNGEPYFDYFLNQSYYYANRKDIISFADGVASPEIYSAQIMGEVLQEAISRNDSYTYVPIQGRSDLRHVLSGFLRGKGIRAKASEILVLSDTHQALDYTIELLMEPGDTIIMEEICYPIVKRQFSLKGINVVTVPLDENGMMTECIEPLILKHKPRLLYINSSYNDPTAAIMGTDRRKILLNLSYKYNIPIYEDDWASELSYTDTGIPSVKALDSGDNVIYTYSFHLTFAPGISVTLIAGAREFIMSMTALMSIKFVNVDNISQSMLRSFIEKGLYQKFLQESRQLYREKRDLMCEKLEELRPLGFTFTKSPGGIYLWCRLPDEIDMRKLIRTTSEKGVIFTPGDIFFAHGSKGQQYIRLNFSYPRKEQIIKGIDILTEAIRICLE